MREIQAIEYTSAKDISKTLKIQISTLRKYAALLDEKAKTEFYFARDEQNNRIFTKDDVVVLKRIIELKNKPNYTLNAAVTQIIELEDSQNTTDVTTERNDFSAALQSLVFQQTNYLEEYQSALLKKDEQLDRKDEQINRLESLVSLLVENNVDKKKRWWNSK